MFNKPKLWKGNDLKGCWIVTFKIDGVRAAITKDGCYSRKEKPLYNLDHLAKDDPYDVEIFKDNWETSVSLVRTKNDGQSVDSEYVYALDPVDKRLYFCR